jgi:hypothetical protein
MFAVFEITNSINIASAITIVIAIKIDYIYKTLFDIQK